MTRSQTYWNPSTFTRSLALITLLKESLPISLLYQSLRMMS